MSGEPQEEEYRLDYIGVVNGDNKSLWIEVELNGVPLKMEFGTGASVSLVSKKTWHDKLRLPFLTKKKIVLQAYSGHKLHVIGETTVNVKTPPQDKNLPLVVIDGVEAPLFRQNWHTQVIGCLKNTFVYMSVNCCPLFAGSKFPYGCQENTSALEERLKSYDVIFKQELGKIKDIMAKVRVREDAIPCL